MKGEGEWTVAKLRELLGKHITAMEMVGGEIHPPSQPPPPSAKPVYKQGYQQRELRSPKSTAGELLVGGSGDPSQSRKSQSFKMCFLWSESLV